MTPETDSYYMSVARAIQLGARCLTTPVGALVVVDNRILTTGYNGTPSGFPNCDLTSRGCIRCSDRRYHSEGKQELMTDVEHVSGKALDRCICVHAEQNAFLTAARFGVRLENGCLYSTHQPCFSCLKESIQAGIKRIVFSEPYPMNLSEELQNQYDSLAGHLGTTGEQPNFVQI